MLYSQIFINIYGLHGIFVQAFYFLTQRILCDLHQIFCSMHFQ